MLLDGSSKNAINYQNAYALGVPRMKSAPIVAAQDETLSSCPVCSTMASSSQYTVVVNEAHDYITGDEFQVVQCATCHLAWTYPQPENLDR